MAYVSELLLGPPPPLRPGNPALSGSRPLVTPYLCRLGDLLCFICVSFYHYFACICVFCVFFCFFWVSFVAFSFSTLILLVGGFWPVKTVSHITYTVLVGTLNHAQPNPILLGPPKTVSWYPASSQERTSWTGVSWGGDEMWSMILLMSRLQGGHSMSAGRRPE